MENGGVITGGVLDVYKRQTHNIDLPIFFASTSKITVPGAGVAAVGASEVNRAILLKHYSYHTIGPDKLNQLRHIYFLRDMEGVQAPVSYTHLDVYKRQPYT